jgi:hypothetical protein
MLKKSIESLVNHHLHQLFDEEKADRVAEYFFNGNLFPNDTVKKVARKVARTVNSFEYSAVALLKTIDCHVGSLNDTGVSQYANIGNPKKGDSLLNKRHHITNLRKFLDRYITALFKVEFEEGTKYGESIHVDFESQLRFLVGRYGLTDVAVREGIQIAITGDGAALTTSTRKAGQTCVGIKMVDPRCRHPITKELCFISTPPDNEEDIEVKCYGGVQSADHCFPYYYPTK